MAPPPRLSLLLLLACLTPTACFVRLLPKAVPLGLGAAPASSPTEALAGLFRGVQEAVGAVTRGPAVVKAELLEAVAAAKDDESEAAEERVRTLFRELEATAPSSPQLLDDPSAAAALDGEWELMYTVAAFGAPGEAAAAMEAEKKESTAASALGAPSKTRGVGGAVNATGLSVDTTGEGTRTTQTFDVQTSRVANDIVKPALGGLAQTRLQVSGPFLRSPANARRADVRFDTLEVSLEGTPLKVTIGWLFPLVYALRPDEKQESWLETTHLSDDLRLARGNKGSIFVLGR